MIFMMRDEQRGVVFDISVLKIKTKDKSQNSFWRIRKRVGFETVNMYYYTCPALNINSHETLYIYINDVMTIHS